MKPRWETPLPVLFAQETQTVPSTETPEGGGKAAAPPGPLGNPLFLVVMIVLAYVIIFLPMSRRQKKEQANLMASIKRGTKVVTSSGIIGTIVNIKDGEDEVVIRSEDAKIRVLRSAVTRVLGQDENDAKS